MSATENVTPAEIAVVLDAISAVAEGIGYRLVKEGDLLEIGARATLSSVELDVVRDTPSLRDRMRQALSCRLANKLVKEIEPVLLPRESDAEIYEIRLTLIKPGASDPHKAVG